jgi:predicted DNA-binding transcriptional regulator AlpA
MSNRSSDSSSEKRTKTTRLQPPCMETPEGGLERKFFDSTTPTHMGTGARALRPDLIDTSGASLKRKLLDIKELEQIYGFKPWTIRSYCSQGKIPYIKLFSRVYFDPVAIDAWIQEHARPVKEVHIP